MKDRSSNFSHLSPLSSELAKIGYRAEQYLKDDPNTSLLKSRQFAELLTQETAARLGRYKLDVPQTQSQLIQLLSRDSILTAEIQNALHAVRKMGNEANHQFADDLRGALQALKINNQLGLWFQRTFGDPRTKAGGFIIPETPQTIPEDVQQELENLRKLKADADSELAKVLTQAEEAAQRAQALEEEARLWESLATEEEASRQQLQAKLEELQRNGITDISRTLYMQRAAGAAKQLVLDESATRVLIDAQLSAAGWEVDTANMRFSKGTRPEAGRYKAIAEWPTANGPADYALFHGMDLLAVVEAKRKNKNVSAAIDQAKRYASGMQPGEFRLAGGPWGEYKAPFVFSSNGRPYLKQIETLSGIWFNDLRQPTNLRRALDGWYSPSGLKELLRQDIPKAEAELAVMPFEFGFDLRDYQRKAIEAVEASLREGKRQCLLAMATGTGKTKTCIALLYRLLKTRRFRRVLFLVDRTSLGEQAGNSFRDTRVETLQTFADSFGITDIDETAAQAETAVHIATVQGLSARLLGNEPDKAPGVDDYDCIIIDECHRGYLLDRELSDTEFSFRDQDDYISRYRKVIEHFDAVRIGMTATPALHTTQIFGEPVYFYSYREAVLDGVLIDYDPPVVIETELYQNGIHWNAGDQLDVYRPDNHDIVAFNTPDELSFDISDFNRNVITSPFNAAICEELVNHISPLGPEKTVVFCVTDAHADMVVDLLKKAFQTKYPGKINDDQVRKITGASDQPRQQIRNFRTERLPAIAVTVDLLTTGIDVPAICNLVFLRKVNSRILFEQMLGRATRRCDNLGKEAFKIFDAVGTYQDMLHSTTMRPVVVNPNISFSQLGREMVEQQDDESRQLIRDQFIAKLQRKARHLDDRQAAKVEAETGMSAEDLAIFLKEKSLPEVAEWFGNNPWIGEVLDAKSQSPKAHIPIATQDDKVVKVELFYGKPEDYLESFSDYLRQHSNDIPALLAVLQRPRELTRADLLKLAALLDHAGFNERALSSAWSQRTDEAVAAGIIGFIRQAALGDPLLPFERRVDMAITRIRQKHPEFTPLQLDWLNRLGRQLKQNDVLDREVINNGPLRSQGGFGRIDGLFDGKLQNLIEELNEAVWARQA